MLFSKGFLFISAANLWREISPCNGKSLFVGRDFPKSDMGFPPAATDGEDYAKQKKRDTSLDVSLLVDRQGLEP